MSSKPVLSDEDKQNISQKLRLLCEQLWVAQGYKKTSIKELCTTTGISIGTFYSLYPTKEALFFETSKSIQSRLTDQFMQTVLRGQNKESLAKALKELFREYDSKPFLYDVNTPDFRAFVTKLPEKSIAEIRFESIDFFSKVCNAAHLKPKIGETQACGILSALLSLTGTKQTLATMCGYFEIFDFMVDKLIAEIFE